MWLLIPYLEGTDSRTNPFEEEGSDENQATSMPKEFIRVPITRARAKLLQNSICEVLKNRSTDHKLELHRENFKGLNLVEINVESCHVGP